MSRGSKKFICTETEIFKLRQLESMKDVNPVLANRAKMVLLANEGMPIKNIAKTLGSTSAMVIRWRDRYIEEGIDGLSNKTGPERIAVNQDNTQKVEVLLKQVPPDGSSRWTADLLAQEIGVSPDSIWRILKAKGIHLARQREWIIEATDQISNPFIMLTGLYLSKKESGIVLMSSTNILPSPGYVVESHQKAMADTAKMLRASLQRFTLSDALNIASGYTDPLGKHCRKPLSFLDFLNSVTVAIDDNSANLFHVFLYRKERDLREPEWMLHHRNVLFHYTKDEQEWTGQMKMVYGMLGQPNSPGQEIYTMQVPESILSFIHKSEGESEPFIWRLDKK